jgi:hypothetical protein
MRHHKKLVTFVDQGSLRVRDDIFDDVRVVNDLEVETPAAVHASLPLVFLLVVFLA